MDNTRDNSRREGDDVEDQEVPLEGGEALPQVSNDPQVGNVSLVEFRTSMNLLAQALTIQNNKEVVPKSIGGMSDFRVRES